MIRVVHSGSRSWFFTHPGSGSCSVAGPDLQHCMKCGATTIDRKKLGLKYSWSPLLDLPDDEWDICRRAAWLSPGTVPPSSLSEKKEQLTDWFITRQGQSHWWIGLAQSKYNHEFFCEESASLITIAQVCSPKNYHHDHKSSCLSVS